MATATTPRKEEASASSPSASPSSSERALLARSSAWSSLEASYSKRDWSQFYEAAEALSKAAFDLGKTRKPYIPLLAKPPAAEEPTAPPPKGGHTLMPVDASLVSFKQGTTVYVVKDPDGRLMAVCDNEQAANLVIRALDAFPH